MPTISEDDAHHAYATARRVHAAEISEREGIRLLALNRGMNEASASDYIRNFRQMLSGKAYHRTLNAFSTELYLRNILADFDEAAARRALQSVRAHVVYYEGISRSRMPGIRKLCDSFEEDLNGTSLTDSLQTFIAEVEASASLSAADRTAAISKWPKVPKTKSVSVTVFERNPHVVAAVLERASGRCEDCGSSAPFKRRSDGTPYLEVHHKVKLADAGEDTVENAMAVCPNCHRKAHYA